jgi:VWFA-related protein
MRSPALATLLVTVALSAATTTRPVQQLQLRSSTSSVAVHVLVQGPRGPVRDLTTADFELTDSGIRQQIATMTVDPLPLDVSIVVDELRHSEYAAKKRHPYIEEIKALLKREDRLGIVAAGSDIRERVPLGALPDVAETTPPETRPAEISDQAAVFDGVARALLRATPPGRQHVVIVLTEGYDAFSFTSPQALSDIARRSDARMHVLATEGFRGRYRELARAPAPLGVYDGLAVLVELARESGGDLFAPTKMTRSVSGPVKRIFDDVRAGYVLYYTPAGVTERGWHPIAVSVTRPGRFEVRARPGYAN